MAGEGGISPFNPVTGEPNTIHTETKTLGPSSEWGALSAEARKALAEQKRAEAAQLEAMAGGAPTDQLSQEAASFTPEQLAAYRSSVAESAKGIAKDLTAKYPMAEAEATAEAESDPRTTDEILNGEEAFPRFGEGTAAKKPVVTPRVTSQQFNQAIDATRPTTAARQKDEIAADEAATKQRLYQEELTRREEIQKQVAAMQAKWQADMDKATAEYKATTQLDAKQVTPMMRLAAGLGALGATLGRTQNFAGDAIQREMDRRLEEKKALMHSGLQKLEALRAGPAQIEKFREHAMADILAKQKAEIELMGAASAKMMARFPQAADALKESQAQLETKWAQENAKFLGERTAKRFSQEAPKVTNTSATGKGNERPTPAADVQGYSTIEDNGKIAARILELQKDPKNVPTPEMRREYSQNEHLLLNRAIAESHGGKPSVLWSNILRGAGAVPENAYPKDATPEQREYLDLTTVLGHYRVFKMGGQTALASPEGRMAIMGPGQGGAGEGPEAVRKDALMAKEFVEAADRAKTISRSGEKEQRVAARKEAAAGKGGSSDASNDYAVILSAINGKKVKVTEAEKADIRDAAKAKIKAEKDGKVDEDALRFFREFRKRKGF